MSESILLRAATLQDAQMLLDWRNDPETKKASHHVSEVVMEEHLTWLTKTLSESNTRLLVAEETGRPVGTVRAELSDGVWKLSWTIAPNARGRGVAKRMVALLARQIPEAIRAEIKAGNLASIRVAECAGLTFAREIDGVLHYSRDALK